MTRLAPWLLAALLVAPARAADDAASVAFNFQDVELPVLAHFVSEVTGRNFVLDDRVRGKVSVYSPTRVTPAEAYEVFQSVLAVKGFTTVPRGRHVKIVPLRDARESALPDDDGGGEQLVTRILTVAHGDAASLVPVLQPLVSKDGVLTAYPDTNRLVVVDGRANVERLAALLDDLDHPPTRSAAATVRLRYASAESVAHKLSDALAGPAGEPADVRAIADRRANAVVLSGSPPALARARALAAELDAPLSDTPSDLHVRRLRLPSPPSRAAPCSAVRWGARSVGFRSARSMPRRSPSAPAPGTASSSKDPCTSPPTRRPMRSS